MFSIALFCLFVFIAALFISLWKEGITFVITVFLFTTGMNPLLVLVVGAVFYGCLVLGEKIKDEYTE